MENFIINWWAILVTGFISLGLGFLWYGPLFGRKWITLMGWNYDECMADPNKAKGMGKKMAIQFVGSIISSIVLAGIIALIFSTGAVAGVHVGVTTAFFIWLGFIGTTTTGMVLWEGKSWKLWILMNGYSLVAMLINGAILAVWR